MPRPDRILAEAAATLDLVDPGVVSTPRWRPDPDALGTPRAADVFYGVARKP